jgi:hypothetical protein
MHGGRRKTEGLGRFHRARFRARPDDPDHPPPRPVPPRGDVVGQRPSLQYQPPRSHSRRSPRRHRRAGGHHGLREAPARLVGSPYEYDPVVEARLLLAGDPQGTESGDKALALSKTKSETCTHRRHHAVIVFADAGRRIRDRGLPWRGPSWVNFVLSAHHPDARAGDRLLVGENEPDGTVKGDRGRVNAVRFRPASQPAIAPLKETRRRTRSIPLSRQETVIYSQPLEHLAEDAQLAVRARLVTDAAGLPHPARITTRLFLADDPSQTRPGGHASRVAAFRGTITEPNGFNCTGRLAGVPAREWRRARGRNRGRREPPGGAGTGRAVGVRVPARRGIRPTVGLSIRAGGHVTADGYIVAGRAVAIDRRAWQVDRAEVALAGALPHRRRSARSRGSGDHDP